VVRVLLAPFLVVLILVDHRGPAYVAAGIFVAGAATDGLDGYLARRYSSTTRTGQWLDPLADKILVVSPVIALTALERFPLWAAVLIVGRELGVSVLRAVLGLRGRAMPASPAAKVKTSLQLVAITLYILPLAPEASTLKLAVLVAAVVLTLATGLQYALQSSWWIRHDRTAGKRGESRS
jgi:CDP-diacylglycerol--glycerol-3-phosphate 3-phosphatidyltransferase